MAIDIKSPEFANAWRIVSEALLQHLQNGGTIANVPSTPNVEAPAVSTPVTTPVAAPAAAQPRTQLPPVYANGPVLQPDSSYRFKGLKDERQDSSIYKITKYSDGTCDIEICELSADALKFLCDNMGAAMPSAVGTITGSVTDQGRFYTIKPGKGIVDGKQVRVVEPLEAEFK